MNICVYVYICVYVCIYVCIHTHIYTYTHIYKYSGKEINMHFNFSCGMRSKTKVTFPKENLITSPSIKQRPFYSIFIKARGPLHLKK